MGGVRTIDCHYLEQPGVAAAFLLREGDRAAFVENNTERALPYLLAALEEEGLGPEQVDYVIVTHVHLDHAGGSAALMDACPRATMLCHPRAQAHLVDPSRLVASSKAVYGEAKFAELYGEVRGVDMARTRVMADGETLKWGERELSFLHTRGHANHHFCVHDSATQGIFTGDSLGLIYPWLQSGGLLVLASTTPTDLDVPAAMESVDRIVGTAASTAYLTHFGPHGDLPAIGTALKAQLERYALIVDAAFDADMKAEALQSFCKDGVQAIFRDLLLEHGLAEDPLVRERLRFDIELNARGVAFAVEKRRFKAGK